MIRKETGIDYPGRFISFEGIEGVGKSTQCARLRHYLEQQGKEVLVTREPGGTPLAESIRAVVLDRDDEPVSAEAELLLMFASRAVHLSNKIIPALERGVWVICDRFTDATVAYQGYGRGQSLEFIYQLADHVQMGLWPDMTLLLEAPIEEGLKRVVRRVEADGDSNRFDTEKRNFFERVKLGYDSILEQHPERVRRINAMQTIDAVTADIITEISSLT